MKKIVRNTLKFIVPLCFGVGIFWYLYKGVKLEEIEEVLKSGVKWEWIALSLILVTLSHIIRAYRWRFQLKTLKVEPSLNTLVNSVFGSYGVNLIFPRLGEIWRCNYMSKREDISFTTVFGSLISERFLDMICIAIITGSVMLFQYDFFLSFFSSHQTIVVTLQKLIVSPWPYIITSIIIASSLIFRKRISQTAFAKKISNIFSGFIKGIKSIMEMENKWTYLFLTATIWILYFFNFYVCLFAFDFTSDISLAGALTLFVMGSLGVVVPVQGGMGPWHFMIISTLVLFGIGQTQASTFALVVHGFQQAILILLGIYTIIAINLGERFNKTREPQQSSFNQT